MYIVPARHLLAFPLVPARCLPPEKRALERSLDRALRRQYADEALCLVIVSPGVVSPICGPAPRSFDPLLYISGTPAFGIVPDGVTSVRVWFSPISYKLAGVRRNLWIVNEDLFANKPCGVDWLDPSGIVLREIQYCARDAT